MDLSEPYLRLDTLRYATYVSFWPADRRRVQPFAPLLEFLRHHGPFDPLQIAGTVAAIFSYSVRGNHAINREIALRNLHHHLMFGCGCYTVSAVYNPKWIERAPELAPLLHYRCSPQHAAMAKAFFYATLT